MLSFLSLVRDSKRAKSITSLAIGKFDGMHIAHFALFKELDKNGGILCVESDNGGLLPKKYRDFYVKYPIFHLNLEIIRHKDAKEFVAFLKSVLPNLEKIVVGYDFRFGKDRLYYPFDLQKYFSGEVVVVSEVSHKKLSVHSGLIRELLINGNLKRANQLLGRPYEIRGQIVRGQGIGEKELVATINLENDGFLLPKEGVYAGFVQLGAQSSAKKYKAVIFIGNRVSTDKSFAIEAHLLGISLKVSEKEAGFYFIKRIRDNDYFPKLELLKEQILKDIKKAQVILEKYLAESRV
ncbi:MAG: bifunctional riboflavin kinase/FAD synthetase [Helicobacter sp.]|nr:bifunctional riboflavin kinase/FAD synthetase [Helicobacteraceae bacterium]MDY3113650.1 bifunctional riboflavin kinase/FAD synthetase [Helicobacter sp.]